MSWKKHHRDFHCDIGWRKGVFYAVDCTFDPAYARHAALAPPVGRLVSRPLSAQEEKAYVERMLAGDMQAQCAVEHNLRLVRTIAKILTPSS